MTGLRIRIFRSALNNVVPAHRSGFLSVREYLELSRSEQDKLRDKVGG